ncbi:hypothetical protein QN277_005722 [Acacia crassicarpa]|uniref:F-box domain-containing protein n=1 Tax=Acacia crassicarpa TaxID=499986 RepID=A0AAE1JU46_9FABA|nr:hypothetical protein QN277_005722 [Acacia crassicarpa]
MTQMKIHRGKQVLPKDVIISILVRLPVRSLIRFQCVCKEWKFRFRSPSFIAEHLQHSAHQEPFLFFDDYGKFEPYRAYLLNCEMRVVEIPSDPYVDTVRCVWAVNSCNGLICLALSTLPPTLFLYVWNPAIREARLVHGGEDYLEDENFHIGFGFSSTVNDYKIVKIRDCDYGCLVSHVEVYSLNIGTWKEVEFGKLDDVVISSDGFNFNGAIFWIGSKLGADEDEDDIDIIVSFDIATELFTLIPMPPLPFPVTYGLYRKYLTIYENKLLCYLIL